MLRGAHLVDAVDILDATHVMEEVPVKMNRQQLHSL